MKLTPSDLLAIGTNVKASGMIGKVVGSEFVLDQFRLPICLHRIHFTKRFIGRQGNKARYEKISLVKDVNYSFIETI